MAYTGTPTTTGGAPPESESESEGCGCGCGGASSASSTAPLSRVVELAKNVAAFVEPFVSILTLIVHGATVYTLTRRLS